MKKSYILIIAIIAILTISSASAGLFDTYNIEFDKLKMNAPDGELYDNYVPMNGYTIYLYKVGDDSGNFDQDRIDALGESFDKSSSDIFTEESVKNAFEKSEATLSNTVTVKTEGASAKSVAITGLAGISDFKSFDIDGNPAAEVIVKDNVLYDDAEHHTVSEFDSSCASTDSSRWILIYDKADDQIYAIQFKSSEYETLSDTSLLKTQEIQDIIDSISIG